MKTTTYINEQGHLTELGQMLYADAMKIEKVGKLPEELPEHVLDCDYCNGSVRSLYSLIADLDYPIQQHPVLDIAEKSALSLSDSAENLDDLLQQLMTDAIEIPAYEKLMTSQAAYRNEDAIGIQLIQPTENQLCKDSIDFHFTASENRLLTLTIENHEKKVFRQKFEAGTTHIRVDFQPKFDFPSGLYYWKLVLKGKKPLVGKIYLY
ncbi:MAG: hypothetical protein ACPGVB_00565 [Chitinophagales bacterium]